MRADGDKTRLCDDAARDETNLLERVEDAVEEISALDWKLQDVVVSVVREIDGAPEEVLVRGVSATPA